MLEDFSFYCPILEVSMLDKKLIGKQCGVAITVGEINSEEVPKDPGKEQYTRICHTELFCVNFPQS